MDILLNISRRKITQTMIYVQLIEYNVGQFFYAENEVARIVPDIFFLVSIYFDKPQHELT